MQIRLGDEEARGPPGPFAGGREYECSSCPGLLASCSARVVVIKSDANVVVINLMNDGQKTWLLSSLSLLEGTYLMEGSCLAGAISLIDLMNNMLNNDSLNKVTGSDKCY